MSLGERPAYATPLPPSNYTVAQTGLTFRERLIVAAVQGLCANPVLTRWRESEVASNAINQADAVIAAMEKEKQK